MPTKYRSVIGENLTKLEMFEKILKHLLNASIAIEKYHYFKGIVNDTL